MQPHFLTTLALVAAQLATQTAAGERTMTCGFTRECPETAACGATAYAITIEEKHAAAQIFQIVTDAETMTGRGYALETGGFLFQGGNANGAHLLTVAPQGSARYSVHFFKEPMAISYHGRCGELR